MIRNMRASLADGVRSLGASLFPRPAPGPLAEPTFAPLLGDLLSAEQLDVLALTLANDQTDVAVLPRGGNILRSALDHDERQIAEAHRSLGEDIRLSVPISPAAEWLIDNAYLVNEQIRTIRHDLPPGYYRQLPKLRHGPFADLPRVYAIALELIGHTDGRVDAAVLLRFLSAYQSITPLQMGELWAVAIMLRIGLVKNLSRLSAQILQVRALRHEADSWAEQLLGAPGETMGADVLRALTRRHPALPITLAAQLLRRLRAHEGEHDIGRVVSWLETQPVTPHTTIEALIHEEHQRQAANQVSVGNTISSMRTLGAINWPDWFAKMSQIELLLCRDPAGAYARSTSATRDRYRHAVEDLARGARMSEDEVARRAVVLANAAAGSDARQRHVGYYLVGAGRPTFAAQLGYRPSPLERTRNAAMAHPTACYLGAVGATTAVIVAAGLRLARRKIPDPSPKGSGEGLQTLLGAALALIPASALAGELVNRAVTTFLPPHVLPRLDLSAGIPAELTTVVVMPTLLLTPDSVGRQLDTLEVIALANQDPNLHFALLTDFADAPEENMPEDASLLDAAAERMRQLAERHGVDRFLLLHRHRIWNEQQGRWMGWERKRGKLEEFNKLLTGVGETSYGVMVGDQRVLERVRYVITLDADTQMPRDVGQALIGTLAHPLNQARLDPLTGRVTEGYGILQPRVGIDLPSATASRFARVFAGNIGVDPYTTAVSDAYMDLFGEGIFAGKGIYDPVVLRTVLRGRFPENALLSHDLIEGLYARVGLLSDVEVVDSYPTTYAAWAARQHRWVRGDWQIAAWLLPRTPSSEGWQANSLPLIARYKIFDNLRRSLTPAATIALLVAGWRWLPGRPAVWTCLALAPLAAPLAFDLVAAARAAALEPGNMGALRARVRELQLSALRLALNVAFLPDQTVLNLDAIARTLTRTLITRRNLLEWETAAQSQGRLQRSHMPMLRRGAPMFIVGAALAAVPGRRHAAALSALPVLADWFAAPALAAWLDQPHIHARLPISAEDQLLLRRLARATWAFFEQFVRAEANFLAPDNFQETPRPLIADRTSPTNIGLQLLADLAAYDFGYIGMLELTERTERVFATLALLERFEGHLLNWYDTRTLHPLPPAYVSTVDSGNFVAALLTLRQGYLALRDTPLIGPQALVGIEDSLALMAQELGDHGPARKAVAALSELLRDTPATVGGYRDLLGEVLEWAEDRGSVGSVAVWGARIGSQARSLLEDLDSLVPALDHRDRPPTLGELADSGVPTAAALLARHAWVVRACADQVEAMQFDFLYDSQRHLFSIGYRVSDGQRDSSFYDLLASEARLGSFLAIARGDVPQEHWFRMGRGLTAVGLGAALLSWSGTMFEYLMPLLLMRRYPETLLNSTYAAAVARQIAYGKERGVPWGISESAYNARDLAMNYQYHAFGVPGLGLKSGLDDDLVIAPYATMLALSVRPAEALENLRVLVADGMFGSYGLYEAVDYTPSRVPPGQRRAIVRSFMAHHQGMSLLALANTLHAEVMQRRFHAEPLVQSAETLLQERVPQARPAQTARTAAREPQIAFLAPPAPRQFNTPFTSMPYSHLLSNGRYRLMLTTAGGGSSSFDDLAITRWRSDVSRDDWGSFIYIRDARSGVVWSTTYQPTRHQSASYQVTYGLDRAEFRQRMAGIDTRMEVVVSPEEHAELRRVTLTNLTSAPRELELTSYIEVVLAPPAADEAHPAFANLFVETEFVPEHDVLLAVRRPRAAGAARTWAMHSVNVRGHALGATQHESDRAAFVGRGRDMADPQALHVPLGGHVGAVLDPVLSLRRRVRIAPGASAQITFVTGIAEGRAEALALAARLRDPAAAERAFELAWTQSQVELHDLNIDADQAHRFQRLASAVLFLNVRRRAAPETLTANTKGQPNLWAYGISGDFPVVVVRVGVDDELNLVAELLRAHEYWRLKRLMVDLVILNDDSGGYAQGRQDHLLSLVRSSRAGALLNQRGGIFLLRGDFVPAADQVLLETVACALLSTRRGDLAQHLRRRESDAGQAPAVPIISTAHDAPLAPVDLIQPSPYGGFTPDGREYVIDLVPGRPTPAPWINVVANPGFGFIISESGGGYTWAGNSRENRLTPWANDPVRDPLGEALYLRDETSGAIWSPTPHPVGAGHVRVRHGFGYSSFARQHGDIASDLTIAVPSDDPVKIFRLRLRNHGDQPAQLTATLYVEWVLGVFRAQMAPYIVTAYDEEGGALLAHNAYNVEFGERVAFLAASEHVLSYTGDRTEFIGRNGDLSRPAGMAARALSCRAGAGRDPCGAIRCALDLAPGEQRELVFLLGQGADTNDARRIVERYRTTTAAARAQQAAVADWRTLLGATQVQTPDPALDLLLNGWLLYQTLACRVWARSAFYQSGGAYGFRDQLQDVMALTQAAPEVARAQILRAAARQFSEGDVQHWWHPPSGRGVRTGFSDDYLWLPYVASFYCEVTGDLALLDAPTPYLEGRPREPGEAEYYGLPTVSARQASLYEHCARAIDYGLGRMGAHGLPLMGAGDWNDGMNLVGADGTGESVWVGWFLIAVLHPFADLAATRGDTERAAHYRAEAERLRVAIETSAWDGDWYLRAFYDDGTPLGAQASAECQIDSLTQSWAVIAGVGDPARARAGMEAVDSLLVDRDVGLIRLFTPAFDQGDHNPGYIKGYLPGVRENGGQYTHAAIWTIWAWALLGEGGRVAELLRLISPVRHAAEHSARYMVEPYSIAADVYTAEGHAGRGGWTWYTGSAGWFYRLGVEQLLGLRRRGDTLTVTPCLPPEWPGYTASYRVGAATYEITVERGTDALVTLDGIELGDGQIPLRDHPGTHEVRVVIAGMEPSHCQGYCSYESRSLSATALGPHSLD
ncbi:GH36-type glycosyl hydrolase domain-containing protein [Candidatus Chloroploca sp. Khr17]|uniref:GH36-type glycosyl hydrolase domain-containing protein n=1 Tax=Candidatus Chloroploca sp. Khr17 TaxID=2496869 RepID=UPI001F110121|nr:glucoamylase family protein [Candidatus Chloroploca sp. Khr17]